MKRSSLPLKTPSRLGTNIPNGHVILNPKWKGSELCVKLMNSASVMFDDQISMIDFHPTSSIGVIYVSESDLVSGAMYKKKLIKLRKSNAIRGMIIAEKTKLSSQYFKELQKLVVFDLGLVLLPVTCQTEAAGLLLNLSLNDGRPQRNPFLICRKNPPVDESVLNTILLVPGIGDVKARMLLQRFKSIKGICEAPVQELASVLGNSLAQNVKSFFCKPTI